MASNPAGMYEPPVSPMRSRKAAEERNDLVILRTDQHHDMRLRFLINSVRNYLPEPYGIQFMSQPTTAAAQMPRAIAQANPDRFDKNGTCTRCPAPELRARGGKRGSSRSAISLASAPCQTPVGMAAIVSANLCSAASFGSSARCPASLQGSQPRRAKRETTFRVIPFGSNPMSAKRKGFRSEYWREFTSE